MTLPDLDLNKELLDDSTLQKLATEEEPKAEPSTPPTPMERTSQQIKQAIDDIATGRQEGKHPALDKIIGDDPDRYEQRHQHRPPKHRPERHMIADVRPPVKERLAVVEHEIDDINAILGGQQEQIFMAASRDSLKDVEHTLDKRVDNVHTRIDRDVVPRIKSLEKRRVLKDWALTISLTLSLIYSVILTYRTFIEG